MEGGTPFVDSPTIRAINKGVIHRICSGQVILDLSSAVKELVENSLDAGASSIEICLKDYGEESFKVIDNGSGISPNNFKVLALKHHTSKIADFPDLQSLATFGFRGEALSSLCALGKLTIETRTKNESMATHLTFDHSGLLICEKKTARQIGTTITVEKLFSTLPVRSKEFSRNIRKEYGKLISLLNAYALIAKGVRLVCTNTAGKNVKSMVLKTQGSNSIKDNIITIFGPSIFTCLEPLNISISDSCKIEGFLSKPGHGNGRNSGDRQFFFVNGRPVDMPKVSKLVNELYKTSNAKQCPIMVMNFTVPTRSYDVNVTPDKRKIFFSDEGSLLRSLREAIEKIYSPSHCSYLENKIEERQKQGNTSKLVSPQERPAIPAKDASKDCSYKEAKCSEIEVVDSDSLIKMVKKRTRDSELERELHSRNEIEILDKDIPNKMYRRIQDSDLGEGMINNEDETPSSKDFTLKAHSFGKTDISSEFAMKKSKTSIPGAKSYKCSSFPLRSVSEGVTDKGNSISRLRSVQSSLTKFITVNKKNDENCCTVLSEMPVLRNETVHYQVRKINSELQPAVSEPLVDHCHVDDSAKIHENEPSKVSKAIHASEEEETSPCDGGDAHCGEFEQEGVNRRMTLSCLVDTTSDALSRRDLEDMREVPSHTSPERRSPIVTFDTPRSSSGSEICSVLQFNTRDLKASREKRLSRLQSCGFTYGRTTTRRCYTAATLELSQPENEERKASALAAATTELERFFNKKDFGRMKVIGQFNLGFIIGRIDQDLFIIDQHAADEKYNFERLSQSTVLNQQPLLRPMRLELSPEEEVIASMHMDIIRKNGFTLVEDVHASPGHHFKLRAVPFSKNITFGAEDVKELISTLADNQGDCSMVSSYKMDTADSICPSRVRAMLASRACRSSVMIGDPLGKNEMQKILEHLVDLRSPWNCPHGRPTMRHLVDLTSIYRRHGFDHE